MNKLNASAKEIASAKRKLEQASIYATHSANSGYKGVTLKPSGRFSATIRAQMNTEVYLGTFDTALEAALAYNKRAREVGMPVNRIGSARSNDDDDGGDAQVSEACYACKGKHRRRAHTCDRQGKGTVRWEKRASNCVRWTESSYRHACFHAV